MKFSHELLKQYRIARKYGLQPRFARMLAYHNVYEDERFYYARTEDKHYDTRYWRKSVMLVRNADYSKNASRAGIYTPCAICGRPIKDTGNALWIRLNVYDQVVQASAMIDPAEDMGAYPIGRDCYRNHPELKSLAIR